MLTIYSCALNVDSLVEGLTLSLGDLQLESSGLARAVGGLFMTKKLVGELEFKMERKSYGEGAGTPWATTMDLVEVRQQREDGLVAQRDVDPAVVGKSAHCSDRSRLLTTARSTCGHENARVLAPKATTGPDTTCLVPKCLPLGGEVAIASRDTKQDGVVLKELARLSNGIVRFSGGMHLGQDLGAKGLSDPREIVSG